MGLTLAYPKPLGHAPPPSLDTTLRQPIYNME